MYLPCFWNCDPFHVEYLPVIVLYIYSTMYYALVLSTSIMFISAVVTRLGPGRL